MEKTDRALSLFRAGYNCAQSIVIACAGENSILTHAATAFGGGMGRMQKTCGAVTGAYIIFGMESGNEGMPSEEDKEEVYRKVREFNKAFIERNSTDLCSELLGEDLTTPEGKARIEEKGLHERVCEKCISDAVAIIDKIG